MAKRDYEDEDEGEEVELDEVTLQEIKELEDKSYEMIEEAIMAGKLKGLDMAVEDGRLAFAFYFTLSEQKLHELRKASTEMN